MADFSIKNISNQVGDIQRAYTWELKLQTPVAVSTDVDGEENALAIRCRSVVIPGRSHDVITSNYMAMEQFFPGKIHFTNPFNITFEEFEDRHIARILYKWQQGLFDLNVGHGNPKNSMIADQCFLQLQNYNGVDVAKKDFGLIRINNAWPESIAEVPMSYADNNAVQYTFALRYDTWEYITK